MKLFVCPWSKILFLNQIEIENSKKIEEIDLGNPRFNQKGIKLGF